MVQIASKSEIGKLGTDIKIPHSSVGTIFWVKIFKTHKEDQRCQVGCGHAPHTSKTQKKESHVEDSSRGTTQFTPSKELNGNLPRAISPSIQIGIR